MNALEFLLSIKEQINQFLDSNPGVDLNAIPAPRDPVYDVKPLGYGRILAVDLFREELEQAAKTGDKLAARFVSTLPEHWYVQDMEDYIELDTEQQKLQEYNCSFARFTFAMMGGNNTKEVLWRSFWPAHQLEVREEGGQERTVQVAIMENGKPVHAVPNDSVTFSGKVLTRNPRVEDMGGVVRRAYDYFVARNKDAYLDPETTFLRTP